MNYNPQKIEKKWQKIWEKTKIFKTPDKSKKPKFYCLDMFPYPSGGGLHVGHPRGYIATDIISHFKRFSGFNVLHPMGWDAFGLPAENYAVKTGIHPEISTRKNINRFKEQIKSIGLSYDWSREINTTDPQYYKWTQWIFLKLYKEGLAYEAISPINWCPSCKTGLANEEVVSGKCERCGTAVTKKDIRQWFLKITAYAERLLKDLEELDWPEKIITMQKNWIGRSEGADIKFPVFNSQFSIDVFTTRADTLFGATFLVLSPEHPLVGEITTPDKKAEVEKYQIEAKKKSDLERTDLAKEKTGVFTGSYAINPANNEKIPIWIADYVLASYSYGAIMAVPAHDQRDFEFAKKYNLPIKTVISSNFPRKDFPPLEKAYEGEGFLVDSREFTGKKSEKAKEEIIDWLSQKGLAKKAVNYKLRDWIFSRQRYWGEPIPLVFCPACQKRAKNPKNKKEFNNGELLNPGWIGLPEEDLPLKLPKVRCYQPTGTGESPLANIKKWVNAKCPKCGGPARRETNTMPQWAGSCWYYLRYIDPKNKKEIFEKEKEKYWLPVDLYIGGAEHAVLHLLYARFWHKFLYDQKIVSTKEPFIKLRNQGLILAADGQKMSKSRGNVVNPDEIIKKYGADTFRLYEMFMGYFEDYVNWDIKGIEGCSRFLKKVWRFVLANKENKIKKESIDNKKFLHKLIKKITEDIENLKFNTAISAFMEFLNKSEEKNGKISREFIEKFLILLSPFAPHISEELWSKLGEKKSIFKESWPKYDQKLIKEEVITLVIQVNGRVREKIEVESDISEEKAKELSFSREKVKKWIEGKGIKKIIFVPGKLINIVV